jgi:hypothetical protein
MDAIQNERSYIPPPHQHAMLDYGISHFWEKAVRV